MFNKTNELISRIEETRRQLDSRFCVVHCLAKRGRLQPSPMHSRQTRDALSKIVATSPRSMPIKIIAAPAKNIISRILLREKFFKLIFIAFNVRADNRIADDFALAVDKNRRRYRLHVLNK